MRYLLIVIAVCIAFPMIPTVVSYISPSRCKFSNKLTRMWSDRRGESIPRSKPRGPPPPRRSESRPPSSLPDADGPQRRSGSGSYNKFGGTRRQNFGGDANLESPLDKRRSDSDPWKVLLTKLDTSKSSKGKIGKLEALKGDPVIDELQCKHFGSCSGCTIQGNFTEAPVVRRAKNFFTSEGTQFKTHMSNTSEWRTHAKLAVRPLSRWGGLKIGLYKAGSHEVEAIPGCRVHHPRINEAVEELRRAAMEVGVKGYEEARNGKPSEGELRYIQMNVERETGKIQLVLVWNSFQFREAEQTLPRLLKRLKARPELWHSVYANFQTSASNAIFNYNSKAWKLLWGPPAIRERVGGANFFFMPQIFRQANLDAFESGIIPSVVKSIPEGSKVAELYSGIGIMGLNAAHRAEVVLCSDSNEYVDEVFDRCADSLPEGDQDKVFYENLPAEEAVNQGQCDEADVLIVDPPRRGLDAGVLNLLVGKHETASAQNLKRLIYVSCGFDALEKDTRALTESGLWKIKSTDGFVLFPGSDHVETVVVFDRTAEPMPAPAGAADENDGVEFQFEN